MTLHTRCSWLVSESPSCSAVVFHVFLGLRWGWAGFQEARVESGQLLLSHLLLTCPHPDTFWRIYRSSQSSPDCLTASGVIRPVPVLPQEYHLRVTFLCLLVFPLPFPSLFSSLWTPKLTSQHSLWIPRHQPACSSHRRLRATAPPGGAWTQSEPTSTITWINLSPSDLNWSSPLRVSPSPGFPLWLPTPPAYSEIWSFTQSFLCLRLLSGLFVSQRGI